MLGKGKMNKIYCCEAMMTAVGIRNVLPSAISPQVSPFENVFHSKLDINTMRVFGSLCYAHIAMKKGRKLEDSVLRCTLLRYAKQNKVYRLLDITTGYCPLTQRDIRRARCRMTRMSK